MKRGRSTNSNAVEMSKPTHLLDTSALLAHYFDEPGAAEVDAIWQDSACVTVLCPLSVAELRSRLRVVTIKGPEIERAYDLYVNELTRCLPLDRPVAELADKLRVLSSRRVPLVDACIAATAAHHDCLLVHRDPHLDSLETAGVRMLRLPDKSR